MTSDDPWELFEVWLFVRPLPVHPLFAEMEYGVLHVFLYAPDSCGARERAMRIARELPYELLGGDHHTQPASASSHPLSEKLIRDARITGVAAWIAAAKIGEPPLEGFEKQRGS